MAQEAIKKCAQSSREHVRTPVGSVAHGESIGGAERREKREPALNRAGPRAVPLRTPLAKRGEVARNSRVFRAARCRQWFVRSGCSASVIPRGFMRICEGNSRRGRRTAYERPFRLRHA
jgi:hypothetical protein